VFKEQLMFLLSAKFLFIDLCLVWRFVVGTFPVECDPGILTVVDLSNGTVGKSRRSCMTGQCPFDQSDRAHLMISPIRPRCIFIPIIQHFIAALLSPSMFSSPMLFVAQYPVRMYSGYSVAYAHCGAYVGSCDWILAANNTH
jgi:hypothetical protein